MDSGALSKHITMFAEELQSGELSLALSMSALTCINEILKGPIENNSVLNKSNSTNDFSVLEETAKRLMCLKLCPGNSLADESGVLNLSCFPNISSLEIKRIDTEEIVLNPSCLIKLKEIKCMFAQKAVPKILKIVAKSENMCNLTKLDLPYNKLGSWDFELLHSLSSLESLNVSNNRLTEIDISENPKLKTLNASFNMLTSIPCICISETPELKTLLLHNNIICDDGLSNLKYLEKLRELSLANNLLKDYDCLSELSDLSVLNTLSLVGNPLSAEKSYRISSVKYLHENACVNHFLLDGKKLNKKEKHLVGSFVSPTYATYQPPDRSTDQSFEILVPTVSRRSTSKTKKSIKKTRDALISENIVEKAPRKSINKPESPKKHLETKVQIESLRDRFGEENWLHKQAGSVIQNLMGLQYPPREKVNEETNTETRSNSSVSIFASSPIPTSSITDELDLESSLLDHEETFESTKDQDIGEYILPDQFTEESSENQLMDLNVSQNNDESPDIEETEGTNYIFTATKEPDNKDVFLVYNDVCFKEKDSLNVDKVIVWPLKHMTSCSQLNSDGNFTRVLVTFHSFKPSLTERIYSMESTEASLFCSLVREELESRPLSAMNQTAYRCIKCSTIFSVEKTNNNKYQRVRCQACGSNAVLEMEESPLPSQYNGNVDKITEAKELLEAKESNDFVKSPSQSSIGSANSLKTIQDVPTHRRTDSDIEVISNPSQSSVEILEVLTRKKSSEERQLVAVPELVTLPEQSVTQGLTESSSSGSLTDSICTAYDGSRRRTVVHDDCTVLVEEDENKLDRNESNNYSKNLKKKSLSLHEEQKNIFINEDSVQLSFSDFSKIDHRVKLHLLTVHFRNNEDFVCSLKCRTVIPDQGEDIQSKLIVFSTCFMHVFKIVGNTASDMIESWLKPEHSYNINSVENISLLPYDLGFHLIIKSNQYTKDMFILLLDTRRTLNFMKFVNECSHFKTWNLGVNVAGLEKVLSEAIVHSLEENSDTCSVFLVPVLHSFQIEHNVPRKYCPILLFPVVLMNSHKNVISRDMKSMIAYLYTYQNHLSSYYFM